MGSAVSRLTVIAALAGLPLLASPPAALGQLPPEEAHVHVSLRIFSESRSFHIGELIPLEMVFTAGTANYSVITIGNDRDGRRVDADQFRISRLPAFQIPCSLI